MNKKIVDRIKKLFALANNNPNIHESELAMKAAKKLLDKHNITAFDLSDRDEVGIKIEDNVNMPWIKTLYLAISELYDCKYFISKNFGPKWKHVIVGTESNRVTASIVMEHLRIAIYNEGYGQGAGFRNAASEGVYFNVQNIIKERNSSKEEAIPGTGLVLADISSISQQDNQNWLDENIKNLRKGKSSSSAFDSNGYEYGKKLNVGARISNKRALN